MQHLLRTRFARGLAQPASSSAANPAAVSAELRQVLAPTGKLRAGLYPGTPTSYLREGNAAPRGVGFELGRELARRLGVPYEPVVFSKNAEVLTAVASGRVDVAFTNFSAARAKEMDFSAPYLDIELGYLVGPGSPVRSLDDVDQPGVRVGVTEHSSSDAVLSRELKNARVLRSTTVGEGVTMLANRQVDAYATNKATLFEMADALPGGKVLDGRWGLERHAVAIPKGRDAGREYVRAFAADVKANGLVREAARRAGLRGMAQ